MKTMTRFALAASLVCTALASIAAAQENGAAKKPARVVRELKLAGSYQDLPSLGGGLGDLLGGDMSAAEELLPAHRRPEGRREGREGAAAARSSSTSRAPGSRSTTRRSPSSSARSRRSAPRR